MHSNTHEGCGCGHNHNEEPKQNSGCGCGSHEGHEHGDGCGCGGHHGQSVTLTLDDDKELVCPVLDIFEINDQEYIALLNPEDDTALLYRFHEDDDESISIENIDSDEEFELVSKTFISLQDEEEEE